MVMKRITFPLNLFNTQHMNTSVYNDLNFGFI